MNDYIYKSESLTSLATDVTHIQTKSTPDKTYSYSLPRTKSKSQDNLQNVKKVKRVTFKEPFVNMELHLPLTS